MRRAMWWALGEAFNAALGIALAADRRIESMRARHRYRVVVCPPMADEDSASDWFRVRAIDMAFLWRGPDGLVRGSGFKEFQRRGRA